VFSFAKFFPRRRTLIARSSVLRLPPLLALILALVALAAASTYPSTAMADDQRGSTSEKKLVEVEAHGFGRTILESVDFYLDALTQVPYNGSYSDVYLSSSWDTSCGWFGCGRTLAYEYTRTVWYGSDPWNAYSMKLDNTWKQNGIGLTSASCSIGWPKAVSCTVSGSGSKTVTKIGPTWNNLWSIYDEYFSGVVDFDDFQVLGSLTETATSTICYYPGQCQQFQAEDSGS
jgi:hypothetical protein